MYKNFVLFASLFVFVGCSAMEPEAVAKVEPTKIVKKHRKKLKSLL